MSGPVDYRQSNIARYFILNHFREFGEEALCVLLDNAVRACRAYGRTHFFDDGAVAGAGAQVGLPIETWKANYIARINYDPIIWLFYGIVMDLTNNGIPMASVNVEDPELWLNAVRAGDRSIYDQHYPPIPRNDMRYFG